MKNIIILLSLISFSNLFAQQPGPSPGAANTYIQGTQDEGSIVITTISTDNRETDILLIKKDKRGGEEWRQIYGGTSYDRGSAVQATTDGGYILVGSTSSYGNGNYDVFLIKTDAKGRELWSNTYGAFFNEYGFEVGQTQNGDFIIECKKQICKAKNDWSNCHDIGWIVKTDAQGQELWSKDLGDKQ